MKKIILLSFIILGVTSAICQVVVIRELINSFYGNEFFIGVILAAWLFWTATGSGLLGKIFNKAKNPQSLLNILIFLTGFLFLGEIFLIRFLKPFLGLPGEVPNLITGLLLGFFISAPLCLVLGLWWTTATRAQKSGGLSFLNQAYLVEIFGFILGGLWFSFFLVNCQEFLVATILIILNSGLIIFLTTNRSLKLAAITLSFLFVSLIFTPCLSKLNQVTTALRYPKQKLLESDRSFYGNIDITGTGTQFNFYENGLILGSTQSTQFNEELSHLSLLEHPRPKKILLLGAGLTGVINEILKHPVEKIYYLELDSKLITLAKKYLPPVFLKALLNPAVEIIYSDGYHFLKGTGDKFDLVIINLPAPSMALINRFYTEDFYRRAKEKLNPGGILVTFLPFSESTPNNNLINLNASIFKTLKKVFPRIVILPEETIFFLASQKADLTYKPELLIQRWRGRKIKNEFLSENYLRWRLSTDRIKTTLGLLEGNKEAKINQNLKPVAYFYTNLFWLDHFYPGFSNLIKKISLSFWLIFSTIFIFLTILLIRRKNTLSGIAPFFSMGVAGFSLMAWELTIIYLYQIVVGYLYLRIALLISALMAGMAAGIWRGSKLTQKINLTSATLMKLHLLPIMLCLIFSGIFANFFKISCPEISEIILAFCAVAAGFCGAVFFPLTNKIYLTSQPDPEKKTGVIYSADLTGAVFGALLPGLILIPVFGVFQNLFFIGLINFLMIPFLFFTKNLRGKNI
jgi:spermidine synthase